MKGTDRKFGIELEVASGARDILSELGLDSLHCYHCECDDCDHDRPGPDWTGQQDCTADGEFISRILRWGTPDAERAIENLGSILTRTRPTVGGDVGNHVHVSREDFEPPDENRLHRLFLRYQPTLLFLAQSARQRVRGYNRPAEPGLGYNPFQQDEANSHGLAGTYLRRTTRTYEFRLWNSTRTAWRLRLHAGLSVAMMDAAKGGVKVAENDPRALVDVIGDYMDGKLLADYFKQADVAQRIGVA